MDSETAKLRRDSDMLRQSTYQDSEEAERARRNEENSISKHYEVPNISSILHQYTHAEQEKIKYSFRVGNFHSLRDLPNNLLAGHVSVLQNSKIADNLYGHKEERSYIELQKGGGFFSKFSWMEDPYELFIEQQKKDRVESLAKRNQVGHDHDFITNPKCEERFPH